MSIGKFITFEGADGCGKSTLLKTIAAELKIRGEVVLQTKEPGNSQNGQEIRDMLFKSPGTASMFPGQADCLLLYDHIGHSEGIVRPALEKGVWVLSDRWADSQFAYSAGKPHSKTVNEAYWKHFGPMPDVTFLLTGPIEMLVARAKGRDDAPGAKEPGKYKGKVWSRIEDQRRIQDAYLLLLSGQPRTVIINVEGKTRERVYDEAWGQLMLKLKEPQVILQPSIFEHPVDYLRDQAGYGG